MLKLVEGLREYLITKDGIVNANHIIEFGETKNIAASVEPLNFSEYFNLVLPEFAATKMFGQSNKRKKCVKGFACGNGCLPLKTKSGKDTQCRNPLEGQAKTYAEFLKLTKPDIDNSSPASLNDFKEFSRKLREGTTTADEVKAMWQRVKGSESKLTEELSKLTKKELMALNSGYIRSQDTKGQLVAGALSSIQSSFAPGSYSYELTGKDSRIKALDKEVEKWTDQLIQEKTVKRKQLIEERKQQIAKNQQSVESPQTIDDYELKIRRQGKLSVEEQRRYDKLITDRNYKSRQQELEARYTVPQLDTSQDGNSLIEIKQTKHNKLGHDLYVASLKERVDRDTYNKFNERAKQLGGYYSSYNKDGAIPGFQFKTAEAAQTFAKGDEVNKLGDSLRAKDESNVEALLSKAELLKDDAQERLSINRLANTARRVRMAEGAEADASKDLATAETMSSIAQAIEGGRAKYLRGIKNRTQVEQLESLLKLSHYERARKESDAKEKAGGYKYSEFQKIADSEPDDNSIDYAEYPYPDLHREDLKSVIEAVSRRPGFKQTSAKYLKLINGTELRVEFKTKEEIEEFRSFLSKAENALQVNSLSQITNTKDKFPAWAAKRMRESLRDYDRLQSAGITNPSEMRVALREYLQHRGAKQQTDPVKKMERDLVGTKIPGYFPTPPELADKVINKADIKPGMQVLEPSAGKGSLIDAIRRQSGEGVQVTAIEQDQRLAAILEAKGYKPNRDDFMSINDGQYDRIVMNPPFEKGQDIDHVKHAYNLLKPGGKLVAITSEGTFSRSDKKAKEFQDWVNERGSSEKLPDNSFITSDNPTGVNTRLVVIEKPK